MFFIQISAFYSFLFKGRGGARTYSFGAFLDMTDAYSEWRRNRRRPCECRAELTKYAAARPLFASSVIRSVLDLALTLSKTE